MKNSSKGEKSHTGGDKYAPAPCARVPRNEVRILGTNSQVSAFVKAKKALERRELEEVVIRIRRNGIGFFTLIGDEEVDLTEWDPIREELAGSKVSRISEIFKSMAPVESSEEEEEDVTPVALPESGKGRKEPPHRSDAEAPSSTEGEVPARPQNAATLSASPREPPKSGKAPRGKSAPRGRKSPLPPPKKEVVQAQIQAWNAKHADDLVDVNVPDPGTDDYKAWWANAPKRFRRHCMLGGGEPSQVRESPHPKEEEDQEEEKKEDLWGSEEEKANSPDPKSEH